MRPSKREIQRDLEALEGETEEQDPVFALRTEEGEYITTDGRPLENPTDACFVMPPSIWEEWTKL
jgi:hypothetical protein